MEKSGLNYKEEITVKDESFHALTKAIPNHFEQVREENMIFIKDECTENSSHVQEEYSLISNTTVSNSSTIESLAFTIYSKDRKGQAINSHEEIADNNVANLNDYSVMNQKNKNKRHSRRQLQNCSKKRKSGDSSNEDQEGTTAVSVRTGGIQGSLSHNNNNEKCSKNRLYRDNYLAMGFTWYGDEKSPLPQCVVCGVKLANESMVPNKLMRHLTTKHVHLSNKTVEYFRELMKATEKQYSSFFKRIKTSDKVQEASYLVAEIIAKNMESHTIGEGIIKQACCAMVRTIFGPAYELEVKNVSLSATTIGSCIQDMSENIKNTVKDIFVKNSTLFAIQIDESTDIDGLLHLLVFVRFIQQNKIVEQYLCYQEFPLDAKGEDIFKALDDYIKRMNLSWINCVGICLDGATSREGALKDLASFVQQHNEQILTTRCFLHPEVLMRKTIETELKLVLDKVVHMVNFIKNRHLEFHQCGQFFEEIGAEYKNLIMHTEVRWLSRRRALCRVYEMKEMLLDIFQRENNKEFCKFLRNELWCTQLAYLADIFEHLNKVSTNRRGKDENILTSTDKIGALRDKIKIWKRKVHEGNFDMFPKTSECSLKKDLTVSICNHLADLELSLKEYIPNIRISEYDWLRNPFFSTDTSGLSLTEEEELVEIKNDRGLLMRYHNSDLDSFWISILEEHPIIALKALTVLLQFSTTHTHEATLSAIANMKTSRGGSLKMLDDEIRVCLSNIRPNISEIYRSYQAHVPD